LTILNLTPLTAVNGKPNGAGAKAKDAVAVGSGLNTPSPLAQG
jgi:hypothetical protein